VTITEKTCVGDSSIGGNKSAEEQEEELGDQEQTGVNVVFANNLQEWKGYTKEDYKKHIKAYICKIFDHLDITDPDAVAAFKADAGRAVEKILGKFNELRFFHGESDNYAESGMLAILEYRGATPYMFFFKHGLVGEQL